MMDYSYLNQTFESGSLEHHGQLNTPLSSCSYSELGQTYNLNQFKNYYLNQGTGSIPATANQLAHASSAPPISAASSNNPSLIGSNGMGTPIASQSPVNSASLSTPRNGM